MSNIDLKSRTAIIKTQNMVRELQRAISAQFVGKRVKLNVDKRGTHSRRRYKAGREFAIYEVLAVASGGVCLWLALPDEAILVFELAVWLHEVEFI